MTLVSGGGRQASAGEASPAPFMPIEAPTTDAGPDSGGSVDGALSTAADRPDPGADGVAEPSDVSRDDPSADGESEGLEAEAGPGRRRVRPRLRRTRRPRTLVAPPAPDPMGNQFAEAWRHCVPGMETCTRPRPARWLLGALGVTFAGAGTAYLLLVGDRLRAGDPGGMFGGGGMAALGGALLGGMVGLLGGDRRGDRDRLRPSTFALDYAGGGAPRLGERRPGEMAFRFAPNLFFPDGGGRLRLFGHVGGSIGRETDVDPRPQNSAPLPGQKGTHPVTLSENLLSLGAGADLAVALPYPVLRRSARLGAAELRWRPEVQVRRHSYDDRLVQRTMLLPLTVGIRWYLSPRQRFTAYVGPRLDYTSVALGDAPLDRGAPNIGSLYGEFWYDIDVPILVKPNASARINGMLTLGYVHSRFDGHGINLSRAYGFLGPAYGGWHMRIRPRESPVAVQLGFGAWVGSGVTAVFSAGAVLPDLGGRRR